MTGPTDPAGGRHDRARGAAHAWLARLRGPHDARDEAAFEDWYVADPAHADAYDAVLDAWEQAGRAASPQAYDLRRRSSGRAGAGRPRRTLALAAGIALVSTAALVVDQAFTPHGRAEAASLVSGVGEIRTVALVDGSRVILDTDTRVDIVSMRGERRLRIRHGRARFALAPDPHRPFRVAARRSVIEARGAVFDVELREAAVIVSLIDGAAALRAEKSGDPGPVLRRVHVGERLSVGSDPARGRPLTTDPGDLRWPSGMLSFEGAPLTEVVAVANRYAKVPIRLRGPDVAALRFTGTVRARDQAGLARLVVAAFDLSTERDRDGALVLTRGGRPT